MSRGLIVAFSGIDGAGKSTQIQLLMEHLRQGGQRPRYLWTRGGYTSLFEGLKSLVRRLPGRALPAPGHSAQRTRAFGNSRARKLWLALSILDLLRVYGLQLRWWRWRGEQVVCDRYLWDTLVDFRLNFPQESVERWRLWHLLVRLTPRPDIAFALLIPVEESVRRSEIKGEPFRDPPELLERRLAQYHQLASSARWRMMDGRVGITELFSEIWEAVGHGALGTAGAAARDPLEVSH